MAFPSGTVTFLFTDIEGSTKLAQEHPGTWETIHKRHDDILQTAINTHNGYVFQIIGDEFCAAFPTAGDALQAAVTSQVDLNNEKWDNAIIKVRMGIHTGKADILENGEYQGYITLSRVQRLMSVGHGGQVLISLATEQLTRDELPEGVSLRDLGERHLKDLIRPEHIHQLVIPNLPADFPPLKTLDIYKHNLPVQTTSFIGREKEMAELKQELNDHRLVTLTGSGGTGKTRLSMQVAADVMDSFPDGVWFLELAPVIDPELIPQTLANLLGLRESAETKQTISELVCGYLHARKVLLVFDNCEHLIESCAQFAGVLLRSCKDVKILASSREALGVAGEMAWHVPSLSQPDPKHLPAIEQISEYESVRLFIERAALVQPHFAVTKDNAIAIAQICFRLDGIPLAIELAAARANVLTVEQIAKRLDDRFRLLTGGARTALPRQQTLRALIDWSYNLLSEEERLLFRRLAVFAGGWTLEAAEAVCCGDGMVPVGEIESDRVLDLLSQLVNKSLVVMTEENGESRYHRLETIRQYAREKLFETEEAAQIRDRHLDYYIQFADQGDEELLGPNDLIWIEKMEIENDNFRTALSWSLESPDTDPQKALQLSGALQNFWDTRGYTSEGFQWLSDALKKAPATPTSKYCRALIGAGLLCIRLSEDKKATIYLDNALKLARQLNIPILIIRCLLDSVQAMDDPVERRKRFEEGMSLARSTQNQAYLAESLGMWAYAFLDNALDITHSIKEAHEIAKKLGNARLLAWVLWVYGGIEMQRANYVSATSKIQEALRLSQQLKEKHRTAHCLILLGRLTTQQMNYDTAIPYAEESLQILRDLGDRSCSCQSLLWLGWNAYLGGDAGRAIEYIEECLFIFRDIESPYAYVPLVFLGRVNTSQGNIQKAKILLFEALESMKKSPDWNYMSTYCLEAVCGIPGVSPDQAARILGKAEAIREKEGFVIPISERHLVDPIFERLQLQLGKESFDSARAIGAGLSLEQAVDDAIEVLQSI